MNKRASGTLLAAAILFVCTFGAGCSSKIEGKYVGAANMVTIELKSGQATITDSGAGTTETAAYTVDGNTITIKSKQGDIVLTYMQDGTLSAPFPLGDFKKAG